MKRTVLISLCAALISIAGCNSDQRNNPDELRHDTAKATKEAAQDAKAVVQGVEDGLKSKTSSAVDVNSASADQLRALPGIDDAHARRIVANRPYGNSDDLVKKHVISQAEYDRISSQVAAK